MKEIKWILYTLYVMFYTSLIWTAVILKGYPVGPNAFPLLLLPAGFFTMMNVIVIGIYIKEHWDEE